MSAGLGWTWAEYENVKHPLGSDLVRDSVVSINSQGGCGLQDRTGQERRGGPERTPTRHITAAERKFGDRNRVRGV